MPVLRMPCSLRLAGCLQSPAIPRSFTTPLVRRGFKTQVNPPSAVPNFAFAFDIDGVLARSSKPLPAAAQSLSLLQKQQIPFILLTNGGGVLETERIAHLNKILGINLDHNLIIQSHTPFTELVKGKKDQEALEDKCVLVVGGSGDKCRNVAKQYGFKSVVTPGDLFMNHPSISPFSHGFTDYYEKITQPIGRPIDPIDTSRNLKIDAILVFNDPRDWALDIQVITDLLLSRNGIVGTYSDKNNREDLPNRGFQQDGQPKLYFSNPDLLWAAAYHQPRLGQGGFRAALEGVWTALTGGSTAGVELQKTIIGKPYKSTYEFAENRLIQQRDKAFENGNLPPLKTVYMIGDNPESDIRGANIYNDASNVNWVPVLVRSGVYSGGSPAWTPKAIVDGVGQAVEWSFEQSRWPATVS